MYPVSQAFHEAVQNGNKQITMLIFKDAVFTNGDINVSAGITFNDRFNSEENISIGQTNSNDISFSLFNDKQLLNDYEFGDFLATIGVLYDESVYQGAGDTYLRTGYATYVGYSDEPYLTRDGRPMNVPPTFPVSCIMAYDGKVWVFSKDGDYTVYNDTNGENITLSNPVNQFMRWKMSQYEYTGFYYNKSSRRLVIYDNENRSRQWYEFCPLGFFVAERPNALGEININLTCSDLMQRFDRDMPSSNSLGISYPTTLSKLFKAMCSYVGLPYKTATFTNSDTTIDSEPEEFDESTMRTVLGWIAEASGNNVKIDRDGYVAFSWVKNTNQVFDENNYSRFEPYWYTTKKVTKLYNRNTVDTTQKTVGSGNEAYLIQDNPFLANAT